MELFALLLSAVSPAYAISMHASGRAGWFRSRKGIPHLHSTQQLNAAREHHPETERSLSADALRQHSEDCAVAPFV